MNYVLDIRLKGNQKSIEINIKSKNDLVTALQFITIDSEIELIGFIDNKKDLTDDEIDLIMQIIFNEDKYNNKIVREKLNKII